MRRLGDALLSLLEGRQEIVLAAPFVKAHVAERILEVVPPQASLTLITRWRLEEFAAGVSDLAVYSLLKTRPNCTVRLLPALHAKYFRADDACLVGSANLTGAALGWTWPANLELLLEVPAADPMLRALERELFSESFEADDELHAALVKALENLPPSPKVEFEVAEVPESDGRALAGFEQWRPVLRQPADLYRAYRGDDLTSASRSAAEADLAALDLAPGLSETAFELTVGARLLQHPDVRAIDRLVTTARRFGEVRALLAARGADEPDRAWQTWMRWLLRFLPGRYASDTPRHSEIFQKL